MIRYDLAFLHGDASAMHSVAATARLRPGAKGWVTNKEAWTAAWAGQLGQARTLTRRAVDSSLHVDQRERAALWLAGAAVREAFFENGTEARSQAQLALKQSTSREVEYGAAFALALSGDTARAQALAADLAQRFPQDTLVQFNFLPTLRALAALNYHDPQSALENLNSAEPFQLSPPRELLGALYPVYVRGLALLAARRPQDAAPEFRKIVDYRGVVGSDPVGVLSRLQLARALALTPGRDKALPAYRDLLSLWTNADPTLAPVIEARREALALERNTK